jgi:hypothetical protein
MERREWTVDDFVKGTNRLPEGHFWNVVTAGQPVVQVSLDPRHGTRLEDPRDPNAPIVNIPTDWDGLVRLAVQIAHMAQAVGVRLPDGVLVKVTH